MLFKNYSFAISDHKKTTSCQTWDEVGSKKPNMKSWAKTKRIIPSGYIVLDLKEGFKRKFLPIQFQ